MEPPSRVQISIKQRAGKEYNLKAKKHSKKASSKTQKSSKHDGKQKGQSKEVLNDDVEQRKINLEKLKVQTMQSMNLVQTYLRDPVESALLTSQPSASPAEPNSHNDNEYILVQTDSRGLIEFHEIAKRGKLKYQQVNQTPGDTSQNFYDQIDSNQTSQIQPEQHMKETREVVSIHQDMGGNQREMMSSKEFQLQPPPIIDNTFYNEDNNLEPFSESYALGGGLGRLANPTVTLHTEGPKNRLNESNMHSSLMTMGDQTDIVKRKGNKGSKGRSGKRQYEAFDFNKVESSNLSLVPSRKSLHESQDLEDEASKSLFKAKDKEVVELQLRDTLKTSKLSSVSPLQQRAKKVLREHTVDDPNFQLRNAPKGIVANRVRQSLQYKSSLDSYDDAQDKRLFGKSLKDIAQESIKEAQDTHQSNQSKDSQPREKPSEASLKVVKQMTNVSKLEPQGSMYGYQHALGLRREESFDSVNSTTKNRVRHLNNDLSRSLADIRLNRSTSMESGSPAKRTMDYLDKQKVDANRVRIERIANVLETQYERQNVSLERNLRNQVQNSVNKHIRSMRNNNGGASSNFVMAAQVSGGQSSVNSSAGQTQNFQTHQLVSHKQGQMLERLKVMNSFADSETQQHQRTQQMKVLQEFIQNQLRNGSRDENQQPQTRETVSQMESSQAARDEIVTRQVLPAIGLNQAVMSQTLYSADPLDHSSMLEETFNSMMNPQLAASSSLIKGGSNLNKSNNGNDRKQLNEEIQTFERRNRLLMVNARKQVASTLSNSQKRVTQD